jgi:predicted TIM-barrel fold metal-dependent hydrolase
MVAHRRAPRTGDLAGATDAPRAHRGGVSEPRIDIHHHYVTGELVEELRRIGVHGVGGQPLVPWDPDRSLATMDRHDIASALLSVPVPLPPDPATARRLARSLNEAGARAVAGAPERFGLLATLPLPDVDGALEELHHALDVLGADGVLLLSNHGGVYPGDPRLAPLLDELDRRAATVFLHPAAAGSPVPGLEPSLLEFVFDTTRAVADLVIGGALAQHPNVRVVVAHAGGTVPFVHERMLDRRPILARVRAARAGRADPPADDELERMMADGLAQARRQLRRLYYDVTLSANETVLSCLRRLVPSTHIVFGTDYPIAQELGITTTLAGLEYDPRLAQYDIRAIELANACKLFPRLAGPVRPARAEARA